MAKKRPPKFKKAYHGNQADADWWRTVLKRREQGISVPENLTPEGYLELIQTYVRDEIPAAIFGVSFLRAFESRGALDPDFEYILWGVYGLVQRLPGFNEEDSVFEYAEDAIKSALRLVIDEIQRFLREGRCQGSGE